MLLLLRNSALLPRSTPLIDAIFIPTASSPTIPSVMSSTLASSTANLSVDGLSGRRSTPKNVKAHASHSSWRSLQTSQSSNATPNATTPASQGSDRSQGTDELSRAAISRSSADVAVSKADMELSKAEALAGRPEAAWIRWKITIVLLLAEVAYGTSDRGHDNIP